jgi:hypothetical protein
MKLCWYCALDGQSIVAVEVAHDGRGCVWVCHSHSVWREKTSHAGGHGKDCPEGYPAGPGPLRLHKAGRGT